MRLNALLDGIGEAAKWDRVPPLHEVQGLAADSRAVRPGFLFAALPSAQPDARPGSGADGRAFVADALARGATAVLAPPGSGLQLPGSAALIEAENPRRLLALLAARFVGRQPKTVSAVTGTNGKTSVAVFTRRIWSGLGVKAAALGTLGIETEAGIEPGALTTPDPIRLHEILGRLADDGIAALAMEASSHGLDQHRLDGVRVGSAAFTNLSRDHLDYHGTMDAYLAAKRRLFTEVLAPGGTAVLNADDPAYPDLRDGALAAGRRVIDYGAKARDLVIEAVEPTPAGQRLRLSLLGRSHTVDLPLAGAFQAWNAVAALGLVLAEGGDLEPAVAALAALAGVPGRLQRVGATAQGAAVYVDYAHTPDALRTVLDALRPHAAGRLWLVMGCGGDRDRGKRPEMGAVAAKMADRVIVTDDNPRSEDAATIRAAILSACPGAVEIGDRARAIREAVAGLDQGDLLLVAGKGHERGQIVGARVLPFDDVEVAAGALSEREKGR